MEKHEGMMHNLVATDFRGQVPFSKDSRDPLISTDLYILLLKKESDRSGPRTIRTRRAPHTMRRTKFGLCSPRREEDEERVQLQEH